MPGLRRRARAQDDPRLNVKLLFDENLSHRLVKILANLYPSSVHVASIGLGSSSDEDIWQAAKKSGFTIVSKDGDFDDMVSVRGFPPKIIWLQLGNCTTNQIAAKLLDHYEEIHRFETDANLGTLILQ